MFLIYYSVFALVVNPILVLIGMFVSYQFFGVDTSDSNALIPYLLVRLFWVPMYLVPVIFFIFFVRESKKNRKSQSTR